MQRGVTAAAALGVTPETEVSDGAAGAAASGAFSRIKALGGS
jgi:hypothetical protein